jgi:hypothetical protein
VRDPNDLRALPSLEQRFQLLEHLDLFDCDGDDVLGLLPSRLRRLSLRNAGVTDAGAAQLTRLSALEHLQISQAPALTGEGLAFLSHGFDNLRGLYLDGCQAIGASGVAHLSHLARLAELDLSSTRASGASLQHLISLTNLQWLALSRTPLTDAGMAFVARLASLQTLLLHHCRLVTDAGIAHLSELTRLRTLNLRGARVTGVGMLPSALVFLDLSKTSLSNDDLAPLSRLTSLQYLFLAHMPRITLGCLQHISGLLALTELDVRHAPPEAGSNALNLVARLVGLPALRRLKASGERLPQAFIQDLLDLPALRALTLEGVRAFYTPEQCVAFFDDNDWLARVTTV